MLKPWTAAAFCSLALALAPQAGAAQDRIDGAVQGHGFFGQRIAPGEFQIGHASEFRGAHKVAISAFNVAFPNENHFKTTHRGHGFVATAAMKTTLTGVDQATRQRIADKAYALFTQQLQAAGYDLVGPDELARLAPEYATWKASPNFTEGRFGSYVAPSGRPLHLLQGDASQRDTSGFMGQLSQTGRALDRPAAFGRSPYIAHDGALGVIAVTLVVDYGVYSSTTGRMFSKTSASFKPGVAVAAGDIGDQATLIEYWGPRSGGFPAVALLAQPVRSALPIGDTAGEDRSGDYVVHAEAAKFEAAADEALSIAVPKLVSVMAAAK